MASSFEKNNQNWTKVESITLSKLLYLEEGLINNSSPSIDVTVGGTTTLLTVPSGITGIDILGFKVILSGNNTVGNLIASIGTNAATYDNILPSTTFTAFNTIGEVWRLPLSGKVHRATPAEVITINITNAVTGVGAIVNVFMIGEIVS